MKMFSTHQTRGTRDLRPQTHLTEETKGHRSVNVMVYLLCKHFLADRRYQYFGEDIVLYTTSQYLKNVNTFELQHKLQMIHIHHHTHPKTHVQTGLQNVS